MELRALLLDLHAKSGIASGFEVSIQLDEVVLRGKPSVTAAHSASIVWQPCHLHQLSGNSVTCLCLAT